MKKVYLIFSILFILGTVILISTLPSDQLISKIDVELNKYPKEFKEVQYAILIDYERPIYKKRLWVVDLKSMKIIKNTHVSHARKSGIIWASVFSNTVGSNLSSKGTFKTLNSYESSFGKGEYKIGMRLKGLEKGINDNVFVRNVVFHCSYGYWSSGCFMTLPWQNKEIIELTKNGNILIVN